MSNHTRVTCRDCGATNVEWRQSKAGRWYLADLYQGARGRIYSDGPHYRSCTVRGPKADHLRAVAERNTTAADFNERAKELVAAGDIEGLQQLWAEMARG